MNHYCIQKSHQTKTKRFALSAILAVFFFHLVVLSSGCSSGKLAAAGTPAAPTPNPTASPTPTPTGSPTPTPTPTSTPAPITGISYISALANSSGAVVTWNTGTSSDSQVDYGQASGSTVNYTNSTPLNSQAVTSHSVTITGLSASTTYNFRVKSTDSSSKQAVSGNFTFATIASGATPVALGQGWTALSNTLLQNVCPPNNFNNTGYNFPAQCPNVVAAWNGGIPDMARNRLIVWGGGHSDYLGNEVYALNLSDQTLTRLNNPGGPLATPADNNPEALGDGTPNSRHTYGGLAYIAHADRMFVYGGSLSTNGNASTGTWTLNLNTLQWQHMDPVNGGTPAANFGAIADYDPNTQTVFLHDTGSFWQYTFETNTYKNLNPSSSTVISDQNNGVIDPSRKLFFIIGDGLRVIDISSGSNYALQDWSSQTSGCTTLQTTSYPGLAFDPVLGRIIGWTGGNTLFVFDPDTKTCTTTTFSGGPGAAQNNGTFGRFRYFPGIQGFALVDDAGQNAVTLKF